MKHSLICQWWDGFDILYHNVLKSKTKRKDRGLDADGCKKEEANFASFRMAVYSHWLVIFLLRAESAGFSAKICAFPRPFGHNAGGQRIGQPDELSAIL